MNNYNVFYISRLDLKKPMDANTIQTLKMASAFAKKGFNVELFICNSSNEKFEKIKQQIDFENKNLKITSLRLNKNSFYNSFLYYLIYNLKLLFRYIIFKSIFSSNKKNIIFIRSRIEFLFWGLIRRYCFWMKKWAFVFEAHDLLVDLKNDDESRINRTKTAYKSFDLILSLTKKLSFEISNFVCEDLNIEVIPSTTGLKRLECDPEKIEFNNKKKITIGYVGTIDKSRGVDCVIKAMEFLPEKFLLRITGNIKIKNENEKLEDWYRILMDENFKNKRIIYSSFVPYNQVTNIIDDCNIVIAPGSQTDRHVSEYASPLKIFDYMVRGKIIISAKLAGHMDVLHDKINCIFYEPDNPKDLANAILLASENSNLSNSIAIKAFKNSLNYTLEKRVEKISGFFSDITS